MFHDIKIIAEEYECEASKDDMLKFLRRTYELKTGSTIPQEDCNKMLEGSNQEFVDIARKYHPQYVYVIREEEYV